MMWQNPFCFQSTHMVGHMILDHGVGIRIPDSQPLLFHALHM